MKPPVAPKRSIAPGVPCTHNTSPGDKTRSNLSPATSECALAVMLPLGWYCLTTVVCTGPRDVKAPAFAAARAGVGNDRGGGTGLTFGDADLVMLTVMERRGRCSCKSLLEPCETCRALE